MQECDCTSTTRAIQPNMEKHDMSKCANLHESYNKRNNRTVVSSHPERRKQGQRPSHSRLIGSMVKSMYRASKLSSDSTGSSHRINSGSVVNPCATVKPPQHLSWPFSMPIACTAKTAYPQHLSWPFSMPIACTAKTDHVMLSSRYVQGCQFLTHLSRIFFLRRYHCE
jgi:hypothetical protein